MKIFERTGPFGRMTRGLGVTICCSVGIAAVVSMMPTTAHAVPSFARQTGLQCTSCHTAYPQLNAFGRTFKLNSYSLKGGDSKLPPLAVMLQPSFTHTSKAQVADAAPHFGKNNNAALSQASIFYGGIIYDKLGAFSQLTYNGVDDRLALDNTDIRWSGTGQLGGSDTTYGIMLNNNPTVGDIWNSTPAWGFPFASSGLAPGRAADTLIAGLGSQVAGLGGYMLWNDLIYAQVSGYRTLPARTQTILGNSPTGQDQIKGTAPYWRLGVQKYFGDHYLSVGTFGLAANTYPGRDSSQGSDRRRDIGLDATYQYSVDRNDVTVMLRLINERARWNAGLALGNAANASDTLRSFDTSVSYLYDKTYGIDLAYSGIRGTTDATLYGDSQNGSPNSDQFTAQLNYLPFNKDGGPSAWKWLNPKLILQYTAFTKFNGLRNNIDGAGRGASDNNTLYAAMWLPF